MLENDTVAAIATPIGVGGVGVIRMSGPNSLTILQRIIESTSQEIEPRYTYHGWIEDIDEIVFVYMKAPSSYTGEDVVEISCHGGIGVTRKVLESCIKNGARLAKNGEFTKRAFLMGKIDLAQAEAVINLINAKTEKGIEVAAGQLAGNLSNNINSLRDELIQTMAQIESSIDFPDDIETDNEAIRKSILKTIEKTDKLISKAKYGKIIKEGITAVIAGKPNVGKSSLLNALLKEDRAIVSEESGTTRDTIEETVNILGIPLKIIDTAGIRHPTNKIEEFGIERTKKEIETAELVILMFDASKTNLEEEEKLLLETVKEKRTIKVLNKVDLGNKLELEGVKISALTGEGIEKLEREIYAAAIEGNGLAEGGPIIMNERHKECLMRAKESLQKAEESFKIGRETDLVEIDLKEAIEALGEVSGVGVAEEIINRIFEGFCVGK